MTYVRQLRVTVMRVITIVIRPAPVCLHEPLNSSQSSQLRCVIRLFCGPLDALVHVHIFKMPIRVHSSPSREINVRICYHNSTVVNIFRLTFDHRISTALILSGGDAKSSSCCNSKTVAPNVPANPSNLHHNKETTSSLAKGRRTFRSGPVRLILRVAKLKCDDAR